MMSDKNKKTQRSFFDTYTDDELFDKLWAERNFYREKYSELTKTLDTSKKNHLILKNKYKKLNEIYSILQKSKLVRLHNKLNSGRRIFTKAYNHLFLNPKNIKLQESQKPLNFSSTTASASPLLDIDNIVLKSYINERNANLSPRHLVISSSYPSNENPYGGVFIHNKVKKLAQLGLTIDTVRFERNGDATVYSYDGIKVLNCSVKDLHHLLKAIRYESISLHFFNRYIYSALEPFKDHPNIIIWTYGAELFSWSRVHFMYTPETLGKAMLQSHLKSELWKTVFSDHNFPRKYVFLSQWSRRITYQDNEMSPPENRVEVIHNFIDTELFKFEKKHVDQRYKILVLKSFSNKRYAVDLAVNVILELSKSEIWDKFEVRIIGDGVLFDSVLEPLRGFKNVLIERGFIKQVEIAKLHKEYGLFLCPTREDCQGISRDEAMSSGLVPFTNAVAAIPEFTDESCAVLAHAEEYMPFVEGIFNLVKNPDLFSAMSMSASEKVRKKSSFSNTLAREIQLLTNSTNISSIPLQMLGHP